ncbi:MAG: selenocysteine-specific translation elongation factor [Acidobacteria bacterium 13_1_40CM_3_65_5]|nr:MAG: selenocysteine-specific translation elongation factor [Acidobacteria bacterium 13_1_40CM_3_65_5]
MKSVVVGTAGHIDHGKSALVHALTGTDPDRLKEEKARGITIDLGFAHTTIDGLNVAFVDVPGHERFVKNMLAGVGGIDLVVLVVAADESVMPQTREHFDICRLLHVPAGLIALTKSDMVDADTLELVRLEVRELAAGSFLEGAPIVPVSAKTGDGLDAFRRALADVSAQVGGRPVDGVTRLPIDRVFTMKGFGTVVTGTLVSGRIHVDDELALAPTSVVSGFSRTGTVKVRGVQVHGTARPEAVAGQRTAVNLGGVEVDEIDRGQTLVTPAAFEETRLADAIVNVLPGAKSIRHGARVRFHQGTAEILGRVALIGPLDATGGVPAIAPGSRAFVRLRLERPTVLARGDRYILRAYSPAMTIAGGVILDPHPPRGAIRTEAALSRALRLAFDPSAADRIQSDNRAAAVMIEDAGGAGFPVASMISRVGIDPAALDARVDALVQSGDAVRADDVLVTPAVFEKLKSAMLAALGEHHRAQPLSDGIPREELRDRVFARGHAKVFERALTDLAAAGTIVSRDRIALATHRVALSPEDERARESIERAFREGGLKPPDASAIAADTGAGTATVDRVLKLLQRQKVLVRIDTLLFHDEALKRLKAEVAALKASGGAGARIDVATFKERFGVSRKFAIPLLEYLDRERVTRRMGDSRVVL